MIETISAVAFALMCWGSVIGFSYLGYTYLVSGGQAVGEKLDQGMDLIWHINNVYEEQ